MCLHSKMLDLEKSDAMICNNHMERQCKYNAMNNQAFMQQMSNPQATTLRDINMETKSFIGMDTRVYCNDLINIRGKNALVPCINKRPCMGYECYTPFHINEYLLIPCKENTYRNHLVCDDDKCCSLRHQMFMNVTKRHGVELPMKMHGYDDICHELVYKPYRMLVPRACQQG